MFQHRLEHSPGFWVFLHWYLLSFNAGYINAGGLLFAGTFVSHVTGFATLFGVDLADNHLEVALGILSVPISFLIGAVLAGLLIDRQIHLGRKPHYDYVMLLSSACLGISAMAGYFDILPSYFDILPAFGQNFHLNHTYLLLVLLCLACGLQNAAITSSSGNTVRTTHLTGITTDLGLGIARWMTFKKGDLRTKKENEANLLRVGTIISFAFGSAIGSWLFMKVGYLGFFVPCSIAFYSALHGRKLKLAHSHWGEKTRS